MLKKIFYLVLICGAVYKYFGVEFIIDKAPFLEPYITMKKDSKIKETQKPKIEVQVAANNTTTVERKDEVKEKVFEEIVVDSIDGDAMILRSGQIVGVEKGVKLQTNDVIKTSDRSYLVLLFGHNSRIKIMARSKLSVKEIEKNFIFTLDTGKIFGDHFLSDRKEKLIFECDKGEYEVSESMFYLENENNAQKIVVLGGKVNVERPMEHMSFVVNKKEGAIFDSTGEMNMPGQYPWIKEFPWKNIAYGVVDLKQDKLSTVSQNNVNEPSEEKNFEDVLMRIKEQTTTNLLNTQNLTKQIIEKASGLDEVKAQMGNHYKNVDKYSTDE